MTNTDTNAFIEILRQQLTNAPEGVDTSALAAAIDALANPEEQRVKIWFLLDRSGSMQHLAGDVIGGFNQFLADQATKPGKVRMTAVQFDGQDPFEVIYDAQHVTNIKPLTSDTYSARGVTPLYDAVGTLIERADARLVKRAKDGCPLEDQLVLVFTDGLENASHRFDRAQVFDMIKNRMDNDWTFVFMGANQDSYTEGGKIGPNLTGFKRDDIRGILMNVINPSAEIRKGFENYTVFTLNGRIVTGFIADQDNQVVVLRGVDGQNVVVPRDDIDEMVANPKSVMPDGLLDKFSDDQIKHLFAFLRITQPLP